MHDNCVIVHPPTGNLRLSKHGLRVFGLPCLRKHPQEGDSKSSSHCVTRTIRSGKFSFYPMWCLMHQSTITRQPIFFFTQAVSNCLLFSTMRRVRNSVGVLPTQWDPVVEGHWSKTPSALLAEVPLLNKGLPHWWPPFLMPTQFLTFLFPAGFHPKNSLTQFFSTYGQLNSHSSFFRNKRGLVQNRPLGLLTMPNCIEQLKQR